MSTARLQHLKLLRRTQHHLVIGVRPISTQALIIRIALGVALIWAGIHWWGQFWVLGLILMGMGLGLGIPADMGETLVFNRPKNEIRRIRHRFFIPQVVLRQPLNEVADVHLTRQAVESYAEGVTVYQCQVILELTTGEQLTLGTYSSQTGFGADQGDPKAVADRMIRWIRTFLQHSKKEPQG